jgi:hypothetical protein
MSLAICDDPEAAASFLLWITQQQQQQQQQQPRSNLSFPLSDVKLPTATDLCCCHDRDCINSILQSGLMPTVNWNTVKKELTFELGRFLHRKIKAHFNFVDSSIARQHQVIVDIDSLLLEEQAKICVLHDKCLVHVVTFSSDVCSKMCSLAAKTICVSVQLDEEIVGGIKAAGDLDQMQKLEEAACTANHGANLALNTKSKNSKDINKAVSCPRGGTITSFAPFPFSASTPVREPCCSEFSPICSAPGLDKSDRWHHKLGTISILCFHASA